MSKRGTTGPVDQENGAHRHRIQAKDTEISLLADESEDKESLWEMSRNLGNVAVPIILGQIFSLFVEMLNLVFAGRLGDPIYVAAAGLGNMYANITCLLIIYGLNSAIATLCA